MWERRYQAFIEKTAWTFVGYFLGCTLMYFFGKFAKKKWEKFMKKRVEKSKKKN